MSEIPNPKAYIVKDTGHITIVYQIKDNNGNTVTAECMLTIAS
jgi:hypothetical protein